MKFLVYGTLMSGFGNNRCFYGDSKKLGDVETEPLYTMMSHGGFPAVKEGGNTSIKGEVWETNDENVIRRVFSLEGCTGVKGHKDNWYDFIEVETEYGLANMFIMNDYNGSVVLSGSWREYCQNNRSLYMAH